ncbi:MAG: UPF0489 family protein [Deltaproteobacteria bacterium]|nr:UPF0489 family protein [Deltaproteobacteria bacterium]
MLALADVHRITCPIGGTERDVFVFDHHRTAFTLWAHVAQTHGPLTLLTLDRHMDLETPQARAVPYTSPLDELDRFARHRLATRNDDHILAALESGAISSAAIIARSHQPGELSRFLPFTDPLGKRHEFAFAPTLERAGADVRALLEAASGIVLDLDLDCFTTRSDGHLDETVCWDKTHIDDFLRPPDFDWARVLPKVRAVTLAREPYHCGGFSRGARLWVDFAEVFFERLLGVPAP